MVRVRDRVRPLELGLGIGLGLKFGELKFGELKFDELDWNRHLYPKQRLPYMSHLIMHRTRPRLSD